MIIPAYHSVLLCFHQGKTDLYFNGLPLGKIVGGVFIVHEFGEPDAPTRRPMTFRDMGRALGCNPYANEQAFKDAVCAAIQAIHFPSCPPNKRSSTTRPAPSATPTSPPTATAP